eukprot:Nk52_evm16s168 gene=Nk52_evmTU16s168
MVKAMEKAVKADIHAITTSMEQYLNQHNPHSNPHKHDDKVQLAQLFLNYGKENESLQLNKTVVGAFSIHVPYLNTSMDSLAEAYFKKNPTVLVLPTKEIEEFKQEVYQLKPKQLDDPLVEKAREKSQNFHDFDFIAGPGGFCQLFASFFAVGFQANLERALKIVFNLNDKEDGKPSKSSQYGLFIMNNLIISTLKYMNHDTFNVARGLRVLMRLGYMPSGLKDKTGLYYAERLRHTEPTCPKYGTDILDVASVLNKAGNEGHFYEENLKNGSEKDLQRIINRYFTGIDQLLSDKQGNSQNHYGNSVYSGGKEVRYGAVVGFGTAPGHVFNVIIGKVGEFYWWAFYDSASTEGCFHKDMATCGSHFVKIFQSMSQKLSSAALLLPKLAFPPLPQNSETNPISPNFLISVSQWPARMLNTADPWFFLLELVSFLKNSILSYVEINLSVGNKTVPKNTKQTVDLHSSKFDSDDKTFSQIYVAFMKGAYRNAGDVGLAYLGLVDEYLKGEMGFKALYDSVETGQAKRELLLFGVVYVSYKRRKEKWKAFGGSNMPAEYEYQILCKRWARAEIDGLATASKNEASDIGQIGQGPFIPDVKSEGMKGSITSTLQPFVELVMTVHARGILGRDSLTRGNWAKPNQKQDKWEDVMHPLFYASCHTVINVILHKLHTAPRSIKDVFDNVSASKQSRNFGVEIYNSIKKKFSNKGSDGGRVNTKCVFNLIANNGSKGSLYTDASNQKTLCSCEWNKEATHLLCVPPKKWFHKRIECTLQAEYTGVPYVKAVCNRSTKFGSNPITNKKLSCVGRPDSDEAKVTKLSSKSRKWESWENMRCTSGSEKEDFLSFAFTDSYNF